MASYIPIPDPITPDWLSAVLRQADVLRRGTVLSIASEETGAFNSATTRLFVTYAADATPALPSRFFLKRNTAAEWSIEGGIDEVKFYTLIDTLLDRPRMIVPCYAAAFDEASGNSYLLLQDLTDTHRPPVTRAQQISVVDGVPRAEDLIAVVETLAHLHAYWWEHPLLEADRFVVGYWSRNAERFERYWQRRTASWKRLIAREGAWLPDEVRTLYEQVLASLPAYWEQHLKRRFQRSRWLTLTHGDTYFANFLCPRPHTPGPTYLLDWQSPSFDIGGYDLANLCATFWTSAQRHEQDREEMALRRYYATLQADGVKEYTWDDLLTDYQHGLIYWLLVPVQDAADGSHTDYWWPKMQCLLAAFREWHCAGLLGLEPL